VKKKQRLKNCIKRRKNRCKIETKKVKDKRNQRQYIRREVMLMRTIKKRDKEQRNTK
jgi:hypothetical protein